MDFTHHGANSSQVPRPGNQPTGSVSASSSKRKKFDDWGKWTRIGFVTLLFASTILVVAIAALVAFGGGDQSKYVKTSKYQAVFINDGSSSGQSVYFGHIVKLTSNYLVLQNIYYISTTGSGSSSSSSSNYSLTKLGCQQLHDPYDQMVINMSQVAFWENLQDSGKVVTAIQQYQKQNPNGPNCNQTSSSATQSAGNTQSSSSTQKSVTPTPAKP